MRQLYLLLQIANYTSFLVLDFLGIHVLISDYLKFFSICLCLLYIWIIRGDEIFTAAITLTMISDFFLLFTYQVKIGLVCFCSVQLLYLYFVFEKKKYFIRYILVVFIFSILLLLVLHHIASVPYDSVLLLSMLYMGFLLGNVFRSFCLLKRYQNRFYRLLFLGFFLFLLCDLHVAIFNSACYLHYLNKKIDMEFIQRIAIFMWLYYLPAQIILAYVGGMKEEIRLLNK